VEGRAFTMREGKMTPLTLDKKVYTSARGVNDAGHFAGLCNFGRHIHAFLYDGKVHDLGSLGGEVRSEAYGINNADEVVGVSSTAKYATGDRAVLWRKGEIVNLGILPGHFSSEAHGINNRGVIVGWSTPPHKAVSFPRAFIYASGKMRDLNELLPPNSGWELLEANGINDAGQIVGEGSFKGQKRAFLMSPVKP
jgi:probable HAF family extracellular repeat protein